MPSPPASSGDREPIREFPDAFPDRFPGDLDLRVDLNTEDDTGLPWAFLRDARDPSLVWEGAWLVVGSGKVRAVAQVAEVKDDLVWVRPLPGPVSRYWALLGREETDE